MGLSQSRCSKINHMCYFLSLTTPPDFKSSLNTILISSGLTPVPQWLENHKLINYLSKMVPTVAFAYLIFLFLISSLSLMLHFIIYLQIHLLEFMRGWLLVRIESIQSWPSALSVCLPQIFVGTAHGQWHQFWVYSKNHPRYNLHLESEYMLKAWSLGWSSWEVVQPLRGQAAQSRAWGY